MVFTCEILVSSDMGFAAPLMPVKPGDATCRQHGSYRGGGGVGFGLKLLPHVLLERKTFWMGPS